MIYIDTPIVAYKTWGVSIGTITENGFVKDYEAEEEFENSAACKTYPYSSEHPHIK